MSKFARFSRPGLHTAGTFTTRRVYARSPFITRQFHQSTAKQRQAFSYQRYQAARGFFRVWRARPTFVYEASALAAVPVGVYFANREEVPVSGRKRFRIVPYDWEAWAGQGMYQQTMQEFGNRLMPKYTDEYKMVARVMKRLIPHSGLEGEEWEVHVINDPMKNAFVIPGGKVFVFRGILDVAKSDDGLAAVLGHEIAHNVAHHAAERISLNVWMFPLVLIAWMFGIDPGIGNFLLNLTFELPGSRAQESEADYIGLMMMSESCYNPEAAIRLWGRMEKEDKNAPPQFLSTHPSSHNRQERIAEWLPKAQAKLEESGCGMLGGYADEFKHQFGLSRWRSS